MAMADAPQLVDVVFIRLLHFPSSLRTLTKSLHSTFSPRHISSAALASWRRVGRLFFIVYIFHPTSSKASLSSSIPSFFLDFLTASWRVMRRRLWMAKTFVLLFTSTKGSFWLSSKEPFSRIMKSFKASFKCFRMTCFWRLVTSQPIMSITASTLTSSPYFSGSGKPPGNIVDRDQISTFSNTFLITHEDPLWYKSLVASWFCFWFRIRSSP